jgi:hypothetical protein
MTGKFETKEDILKWKYRGKIGAKSENNFKKGKKRIQTKRKSYGDRMRKSKRRRIL